MPWSVAQTEPLQEKSAQAQLDRAGFGTYLPMMAGGHGTNVPLFPTYVLVDLEASWWQARWTRGVTRLLMAGDRPARIPESVVDDLRKRERNGVVVLPRKDEFEIGQSVRVTGGAFVGYLAIYQGMSGNERQCVLLELLGRLVPVALPLNKIEAVSCAQKRNEVQAVALPKHKR